MNAYKSGQYRNLFSLIGKSEADVSARLEQIWQTFFYGSEEERIYHPVEPDMGYLEDTGNNDARTEGMSYGMMFCVQTNHKEEFDRIWKWAYTYMWQRDGFEKGYFAWSCTTDGRHNSEGAAPDGEEYFAMALFFASKRWGDGEGIYEYSKHARTILSDCIHKGEPGRPGRPMWNHDNKQILFVAGIDFTDPSYHLPHFYELFAEWANPEDRAFFKEAAMASRRYLAAACHPVTGMSAEYADFDGTPHTAPLPWSSTRHDWFFSDSYRTAANIGLDYEWFGIDCGQYDACGRLLSFLDSRPDDGRYMRYTIDGQGLGETALHPIGLYATTTEGLLAVIRDDIPAADALTGSASAPADSAVLTTSPAGLDGIARKWLQQLWDTPMRTGKWRYYDNCLYFFAFLALSGHYRIYK